MRISTSLLIGIFSCLLNSSLCFAASTYLFGDGSCSVLSGVRLTSIGKNCPKTTLIFSLKDSLDQFCQHDIKPGETLREILSDNKYYRSRSRTRVVNFNSGQSSRIVNSKTDFLLFSKRDLLTKDQSNCKKPQTQNLKRSAFVLHIPNSLYVLKSGLKKINEPPLFTEDDDYNKPVVQSKKNENQPYAYAPHITGAQTKSDFFKNSSLEIKPRLFYENLESKQTSNGALAEASSKLSPSLYLNMRFQEDKVFQFNLFSGINFHIYNEKTGQLFIANNNVQTIELGAATQLEYFKYFTPKVKVSLFEDLYFFRQSSTELALERELITRLQLANRFYFHRTQYFSVSLEPTFIYDLAHGELDSGIGYQAPLSFNFNQKHYSWSFNINYMLSKKELTDSELTRTLLSFQAHMGFKF